MSESPAPSHPAGTSPSGILTPEPRFDRPPDPLRRPSFNELLLLAFAAVVPVSVAAAQILLLLFAVAWLFAWRRGHTGELEPVRARSMLVAIGLALALLFAGEWLACLVNGAFSHLPDPLRKHAVLLVLPLLAWKSIAAPEIYRRAVGVAVAVAAIVAVYATWQHFSGLDLVRQRILEPRGEVFIATGAFSHHLTYGGSVMLAFVAAAALAGGGNRWRGLPLLLAACLGLGLLWSYARSAWFGAAAGLLVILAARRGGRLLGLVGAGILGAIVVLALDPSLRDRFREGFAGGLGSILGGGPGDAAGDSAAGKSLPPRALLLLTSLRMLADHPLGIGPGRFEELFPLYRVPGDYMSTVHSHCDVMRALVDGGPLSLLGYLLLVPGSALAGWRALRGERREAALSFSASHVAAARHDILLIGLGASAAFFVAGFFQTYFWDQEDVMLWLLLAAPAAAELGRLVGRGAREVERIGERASRIVAPAVVPPNAKRILVLCDGNMCRSPFAALLLASELERAGAGHVRVESAGLHAGPDDPAPPFAREAAAGLGVSLTAHRSQRADPAMIAAADWILVMTLEQRRRLIELAPDARGRVELLGRFHPERLTSPEIPDPMTGDLDGFQRVYAQIAAAVRPLARILAAAAAAPPPVR